MTAAWDSEILWYRTVDPEQHFLRAREREPGWEQDGSQTGARRETDGRQTGDRREPHRATDSDSRDQ